VIASNLLSCWTAIVFWQTDLIIHCRSFPPGESNPSQDQQRRSDY
jgi:hypothetical protein